MAEVDPGLRRYDEEERAIGCSEFLDRDTSYFPAQKYEINPLILMAVRRTGSASAYEGGCAAVDYRRQKIFAERC